jgi:hypothetical protein
MHKTRRIDGLDDRKCEPLKRRLVPKGYLTGAFAIRSPKTAQCDEGVRRVTYWGR